MSDTSTISHPFIDLAKFALAFVVDHAEHHNCGRLWEAGVAFAKAEAHLHTLIQSLEAAVRQGQEQADTKAE
jgi:hypothetical protein